MIYGVRTLIGITTDKKFLEEKKFSGFGDLV